MEKISRTKIVDLLKRRDFGAMVNVKGWVRTRRGSKQVNFIALNDGSTINNVQIVVDLANFDEEMLKQITTGACISVNGAPSDIYDQLYAEGASMAGFLPGEETTLRELLYGILLPSGAECCLTAARYIAGSEEAFVELMNQKAAQLGMEN